MIYNDPNVFVRQKPQKVTLTITGEGDENYGYIQIEGLKYWTAQAIEVDVGTEAACIALCTYTNLTGAIVINGEKVQDGDDPDVPPYMYTVQRNADFNFSMSKGYWNLNITETPEAPSTTYGGVGTVTTTHNKQYSGGGDP